MSHFARSDELALSHSREAFASFEKIVNKLKLKNNSQLVCHIANSGGLLYFSPSCSDMVRPGISLYGYYPDGIDGRKRSGGKLLKPVMSFYSRVLQVKELPPGRGVSYGHTFVTETATRLAVLPVGYEDGLLRHLSNRGSVLIHGQPAPIRGRICMNLCMVDVSEIPDVKAGDKVVIMGEQGGESISADDIGRWGETISYEVLCLFGNNNVRKYTNFLDDAPTSSP